MTDFRARVVLEAQVSAFQQGMQVARREMAGVTSAAKQQGSQMTQLGLAMGGAGVVIGAGLGLATRAAIDWESAWTGVKKTVAGSPEQLARVEAGLRDLAMTLPATHEEIAAVAEAAGQLGIATGDVVAFTKVMVDLGETTNLTADEAATSIAQLMNIMQTAPDQVDELGSALVALGNNGASTERDIIQMAQRIAGAGKIVGLTEADVLALANAVASVGIEVEAGGSSISRVIQDIGKAVATGSEKLTGFARTAGMSAADFTTAFREDPAGAVASFVEGLGAINRAGGDVFTVLDDLGFADIRVSRSLLAMAGAGTLLRDSLELGAQAWDENTALIEEAGKRYDTTEAKIAIARNTLTDLAIDIGGTVLPAVSGLAEGTADLVTLFAGVPGPVRTAGVAVAGLTAGVLLLGGGMLVLLPRVMAVKAGLDALAASAPRTAAALRLVGKSAGIVGVLAAVAGAVFAIGEASKDAGPGVGEMTKALLDLEAAADTAAFREFLGITDEAVANALKWGFLGDTVEEVSAKMALSSENLESLDSALTNLVTGGQTERAGRLLAAFAEFAGLTDDQLTQLSNRSLPQYRDALAEIDVAQQLANEAMTETDRQLETLAARFGFFGDEAADAAQEMLEAWAEASAGFLDVVGAYTDVLAEKEDAERETAEATAAATDDSSDSWEDYIGDVTVSLDEYLNRLAEMVAAQEAWATNMVVLASRVPDAVLDELVKLGPEGAPLVADLVDASDEEMDRFIELMDRKSELGSTAWAMNLAEAGPELEGIARTNGATVAAAVAEEMIARGGTVHDAAVRLGVRADEGIRTGLRPDQIRNIPIGTTIDSRSVAQVERQLAELTKARFIELGVRVSGVTGAGGFFAGTGHSGGMVTPAGVVPRFHGGAALIGPVGSSGLAPDEVPAILQTGERVLSRGQNDLFERLIRGLATPASPSMTGTGQGGQGPAGIVVQHMELKAVGQPFQVAQVAARLERHAVQSGAS